MTRNLKKIGAAAGIAYPVLQMAAQGLIQIGGSEPPFSASAQDILAFFQARNLALFQVGGYISVLSVVVFIWFLGALWDTLHNEEGGTGWLSMIAIGSGVATAAALNEGGWSLAVFRLNDGIDPQIARLLFDQGNFNFANSWVTVGSMVLAAGLILKRSNRFPSWFGWVSILLAVGLFLARVVWTSSIAFAPYVLYWVWMITLGVMMMRRASTGELSEQ
jgi:hypothetical protein